MGWIPISTAMANSMLLMLTPDGDGILNGLDSDMDDGTVNALDDDMDGDGIVNVDDMTMPSLDI